MLCDVKIRVVWLLVLVLLAFDLYEAKSEGVIKSCIMFYWKIKLFDQTLIIGLIFQTNEKMVIKAHAKKPPVKFTINKIYQQPVFEVFDPCDNMHNIFFI